MKRLSVFLLLPIIGCSHFICRPDDSSLKKTGKVSARVLTGIFSFGFTEVFIEDVKIKEKREKQAEEERIFWAAFWQSYREADAETKDMMRLQLQWIQTQNAAATQRSIAASEALRTLSAWRASSPYRQGPVIFAPQY